MTKWLISYRMQTIFYYRDRHSTTEPRDVVSIIDDHPAAFAARFREEDGPFPDDSPGHEHMQRVDRLLLIYSAIEMPDSPMAMAKNFAPQTRSVDIKNLGEKLFSTDEEK